MIVRASKKAETIGQNLQGPLAPHQALGLELMLEDLEYQVTVS